MKSLLFGIAVYFSFQTVWASPVPGYRVLSDAFSDHGYSVGVPPKSFEVSQVKAILNSKAIKLSEQCRKQWTGVPSQQICVNQFQVESFSRSRKRSGGLYKIQAELKIACRLSSTPSWLKFPEFQDCEYRFISEPKLEN